MWNWARWLSTPVVPCERLLASTPLAVWGRIHHFPHWPPRVLHCVGQVLLSCLCTPTSVARSCAPVREALVVVGDFTFGAVRFKAKDPGINFTSMELALVFVPQGATIEALHLWSEENVVADALSRWDEITVVPAQLTKVQVTPQR